MFTQDDYINEIETARENGEAKGREEAKADVAKSMIKEGFGLDLISKLTGFNIDELNRL